MNQQQTLSRRSLRRHATVGGAAIVLATAIPAVQQAFARNGDYQLVCTTDGVRVRTTPGLSGTVIGSVHTGNVVNVTGETVFADGHSWVPVTVQGSRLSG